MRRKPTATLHGGQRNVGNYTDCADVLLKMPCNVACGGDEHLANVSAAVTASYGVDEAGMGELN